MTETEERVVIGRISGAHGVRGELKLALFVDDAEFLQRTDQIWLGRRPPKQVTLRGVRFHGGNALLTLEGVDSRTEAEQLRGREVSVPLALLPPLEEDEYYVAQIVGLAVETAEGEPLGEVAEVLFTGANEVYIVRGGARGEILLPAIESVIQSVDLDAGRIVVQVPEGLLD